MILKRTIIERGKTVYVYKCEKCRYEYEVVWIRKEKSRWDDISAHKKWIGDYVTGRFRR